MTDRLSAVSSMPQEIIDLRREIIELRQKIADGPVMPETPPSEAIEAQCTDAWIGHPDAHQISIDRWMAAQRVDARRRYSIIRNVLLPFHAVTSDPVMPENPSDAVLAVIDRCKYVGYTDCAPHIYRIIRDALAKEQLAGFK